VAKEEVAKRKIERKRLDEKILLILKELIFHIVGKIFRYAY